MNSSNGLDWIEHGTIYTATSSGFESAEVIAPTVLFENGTWYMWYEADDAAQPGRRRVGLATATNPINGPWIRRGIALNFFSPNTDEGSLLGTPAIAKVGTHYLLFYHGFSDKNGTARSADRIFVAYANSPLGPWTKEGGNSTPRPILDLGSGWECCKVAPSSVVVYGDRVMVFYEGWNGIQEHIINWQRGESVLQK